MLKLPKNIKMKYSKKQKKLNVFGQFGKVCLSYNYHLPFRIENGYLIHNFFLNNSGKVFFSNIFRDLNEGSMCELVIKGINNDLISKMGVNREMTFRLGNSHETLVLIPQEFIWVRYEKPKRKLILYGSNKNILYAFACRLRKLKKKTPYQSKGIYFSNETFIKKKVQKKSK